MSSEYINGFLVTNDSGEFEAEHGWEFGITGETKGFKRPKFATSKSNGGMTIPADDQLVAGEFWVESRRGPKVIRDLDGLGIEIDRAARLDRQSEGY